MIEPESSFGTESHQTAGQRGEFQDVMRDRFVKVIEDEIGRKVTAMMSGTHQHPDLHSELFVLESADILVDPWTRNSPAPTTSPAVRSGAGL